MYAEYCHRMRCRRIYANRKSISALAANAFADTATDTDTVALTAVAAATV